MKILIIEDSETDAELLVRDLRRIFPKFSHSWISTREEFDQVINSETWDMILSDYNLPGFSPLMALKTIKELKLQIPLIVISGAVGEELAAEVMREGADDLVLKSNLPRLEFSIQRSLREQQIRNSEQALRVAAERAIRDREEMLAVVTHDLKNPLGAISLNLELMKRLLEPQPLSDREIKISTQVDRITRSVYRMANLIKDVLDLEKIEAGRFIVEPSAQRADELISDVIDVFEPLAQQKSVLLSTKFSTDIRSLHFDYERVFQVVSNLVSNAIKFSNENGLVQLLIRQDENFLTFSVVDQGPGIAAEDLPFVFDRFWQSKQSQKQGTGLGLAIAQGIVTAHRGKIWVESELGQGSTFHFTLPQKAE